MARFCEVSAVLEQAHGLIERGLLASGRRERFVTNPAWRIYRDAVGLQLALARALGILPMTSRSGTSPARPTG